MRRATDKDIPRVVQLWLEMMRQHREFEPRIELSSAVVAAYQSYLMLHARNEKSLLLVAENADGLQGFCCAYVCANLPMFAPAEFGLISDIYLRPAFRGQGHGTDMVRRAMDLFQRHGVRAVHLQVYHKNERGKAFWRARGFEPFVDRMALDLSDAEADPEE
ncbi:MAG TPA: GNAT family N-acetyltransferase [Sumerlaeia bacterium]|nr:GNAT family N-acetyltransferase [Sumerlaeia bacterium]